MCSFSWEMTNVMVKQELEMEDPRAALLCMPFGNMWELVGNLIWSKIILLSNKPKW